MYSIDFLYEYLPFSIFDEYLVSHLSIPQKEFEKYKLSTSQTKKELSSIDMNEPAKQKSSKKPAKPKEKEVKPVNEKAAITNFFKKIEK